MVSRVRIDSLDGVRDSYEKRLAGLGAGDARKVMMRVANRAGKTTSVQVKRALVKQTSIPRAVVQAAIRDRGASAKGAGAIEYVITGRGSELPLSVFNPRQFSAGTRAKVWGRFQTFEGAFMGPRPGTIAPALGGEVFHRTSKSRLPIEKLYGPSIPKEMVLAETAATFQRVARAETEKRLVHELGRILG
jgi:hypothetical protein